MPEESIHFEAQVAALPVKGKPGSYCVLLVTSRETHRWIIPKGWPIKGRKDHEAAAREALQEAGVSGHIHKHPMGAYTYDKSLADGAIKHVRVMVYLLKVDREISKWLEKDQRKREWVSTREAAKRVDEDGLVKIIKLLDVSGIDAKDSPA